MQFTTLIVLCPANWLTLSSKIEIFLTMISSETNSNIDLYRWQRDKKNITGQKKNAQGQKNKCKRTKTMQKGQTTTEKFLLPAPSCFSFLFLLLLAHFLHPRAASVLLPFCASFLRFLSALPFCASRLRFPSALPFCASLSALPFLRFPFLRFPFLRFLFLRFLVLRFVFSCASSFPALRLFLRSSFPALRPFLRFVFPSPALRFSDPCASLFCSLPPSIRFVSPPCVSFPPPSLTCASVSRPPLRFGFSSPALRFSLPCASFFPPLRFVFPSPALRFSDPCASLFCSLRFVSPSPFPSPPALRFCLPPSSLRFCSLPPTALRFCPPFLRFVFAPPFSSLRFVFAPCASFLPLALRFCPLRFVFSLLRFVFLSCASFLPCSVSLPPPRRSVPPLPSRAPPPLRSVSPFSCGPFPRPLRSVFSPSPALRSPSPPPALRFPTPPRAPFFPFPALRVSTPPPACASCPLTLRALRVSPPLRFVFFPCASCFPSCASFSLAALRFPLQRFVFPPFASFSLLFSSASLFYFPSVCFLTRLVNFFFVPCTFFVSLFALFLFSVWTWLNRY